jgi:hypothetical protein
VLVWLWAPIGLAPTLIVLLLVLEAVERRLATRVRARSPFVVPGSTSLEVKTDTARGTVTDGGSRRVA